ncbi:MAG: four helix bundle protein [Acidobacteriota bacterium]
MKDIDLKIRTKKFALRIINPFTSRPKTTEAQVIGKQVLRSGTSVGAQYREACRARSNSEFISKMQSSLQELDETSYWFELLVEGQIVDASKLQSLRAEANELTAIFVSSVKTAKTKK